MPKPLPQPLLKGLETLTKVKNPEPLRHLVGHLPVKAIAGALALGGLLNSAAAPLSPQAAESKQAAAFLAKSEAGTDKTNVFGCDYSYNQKLGKLVLFRHVVDFTDRNRQPQRFSVAHPSADKGWLDVVTAIDHGTNQPVQDGQIDAMQVTAVGDRVTLKMANATVSYDYQYRTATLANGQGITGNNGLMEYAVMNNHGDIVYAYDCMPQPDNSVSAYDPATGQIKDAPVPHYDTTTTILGIK